MRFLAPDVAVVHTRFHIYGDVNKTELPVSVPVLCASSMGGGGLWQCRTQTYDLTGGTKRVKLQTVQSPYRLTLARNRLAMSAAALRVLAGSILFYKWDGDGRSRRTRHRSAGSPQGEIHEFLRGRGSMSRIWSCLARAKSPFCAARLLTVVSGALRSRRIAKGACLFGQTSTTWQLFCGRSNRDVRCTDARRNRGSNRGD